MAASNNSWTISEVGTSEGASGADRHKPDGQVDFAASLSEARQNLPTEAPKKFFDVNSAPERVNILDPDLAGGIPDPGCGDQGTPLDFAAVAPDTDKGVGVDLDGSAAPGASRFVLPGNRPD